MIMRIESEWGVEFPSLTFSSFLCPTDSARRANRRQKNAAQGRAPARPLALGTRSPAKVVLGLDAECSAACFSLPSWPLPATGKCRRGRRVRLYVKILKPLRKSSPQIAFASGRAPRDDVAGDESAAEGGPARP